MPNGTRNIRTQRSQPQSGPEQEPRTPQQTPAQSEPATAPQQGSENVPVASWSYYSQGGQIEVAVWENVVQDRNGKERVNYSVTITRSYRQEDGEYKRTKSLFAADVPLAIVLLNQAMAWIVNNQELSV